MFRDAPDKGPREITFTDTEFETKEVLEHFLSMAVHSKLAVPVNADYTFTAIPVERVDECTLEMFLDVIKFMQKYDCAPTLRAFCSEISMLVLRGYITHHDGFALGAVADCELLCAACVSQFNTAAGPNETTTFVALIPRLIWRLAPPKYFHALMKTKYLMEVECDADSAEDMFRSMLARTEWDGWT